MPRRVTESADGHGRRTASINAAWSAPYAGHLSGLESPLLTRRSHDTEVRRSAMLPTLNLIVEDLGCPGRRGTGGQEGRPLLLASSPHSFRFCAAHTCQPAHRPPWMHGPSSSTIASTRASP